MSRKSVRASYAEHKHHKRIEPDRDGGSLQHLFHFNSLLVSDWFV
jgi:hypothetical protein